MNDTEILDALHTAIVHIEGERVRWANAAARTLFPRLDEKAEGWTLDDLLQSTDVAKLKETLERLAGGWSAVTRFRVQGVGTVPSPELEVHIASARAHRDGIEAVLTFEPMAEKARAERLVSALVRLGTGGQTPTDLATLLDSSGPIFESLGWAVALLATEEAGARLERLIAWGAFRSMGEGYLERVQSLPVVPWDAWPIMQVAVEEDRPIFVDDIPTRFPDHADHPLRLASVLHPGAAASAVWCPVHGEERVTHVLVAVGTDLTEHDFMALQFFAAQISAVMRLEGLRAALVRRERLAAVGEMAAVLAHEVRNPLGVIFNAVVGLRRLVGENATAVHLLDILSEEAGRLKRVVSELVDFARPAEPASRPIALSRVLGEALDAAAREVGEAAEAVEVRTQVPDDLPPVFADPLLLHRAFVNLLVNAFQHQPEGGEIEITAETAPEAEAVVLHFANGGPPIPEEVRERAFEPFFTTKATGTGLGLAVVRRIVEDLSGRIELLPRRRGASFQVTLPAAAGESAQDW